MDTNRDGIRHAILELIKSEKTGSYTEADDHDPHLDLQALQGDGSARRFFRVYLGERPVCIAVLTGSSNEHDFAEFRSAVAIGRHLQAAGVPVPSIIAVNDKRGIILFEDLGDIRLHDLLRRNKTEALSLYKQVVRELAHMQIAGAVGFDTQWCCDTAKYDRKVMLERESGYFLKSFWQDTLFSETVEGINDEFAHLAARAEEYFEPLFLHRDFQSRNIMIKGGEVRIIDFQGGRLGPPGYDIASLLIDPYASLSDRRQDELLNLYLDEIAKHPDLDVEAVAGSYPYLAIQRNLQIIGAFAYLSGRKRKKFFLPYIIPALIMLQNRLARDVYDDYPVLRKTISESIRRYRESIR